MLEFKVIQELKPNNELLELIKDYNYTAKNGKVKYLLHTNPRQFNKFSIFCNNSVIYMMSKNKQK